jgi:DNA-binding transcriptional MerR regulator
MDGLYPIRAVAKITGISTDTLRAWEKRYQAVVPDRSSRGRLYGSPQIERLRLLSQLVQRGHSIGGIARRDDEQLRHLLTERPSATTALAGDSAPIIAPVIAAIEEFDVLKAGDELARLAAVLRPRDVVYEVVLPLMEEVGQRWQNKTFCIAQEHLVSQVLRNLMGSMMRLFRPTMPDRKVILAAPAGERHEFGLLCSAMLIAIAGAAPIYIGVDLPASEIITAAQRTRARAVLFGVTIGNELTPAEIAQVDAALPEDAGLWIGGAASAELQLPPLRHDPVILENIGALEEHCGGWLHETLHGVSF